LFLLVIYLLLRYVSFLLIIFVYSFDGLLIFSSNTQAHIIKDRNNNAAKAVLDLESQYRWSLTGIPLQNRVGELYFLVIIHLSRTLLIFKSLHELNCTSFKPLHYYYFLFIRYAFFLQIFSYLYCFCEDYQCSVQDYPKFLIFTHSSMPSLFTTSSIYVPALPLPAFTFVLC
jgi:CBS domain containing-hemolysin-like protein